MRARLAPASVLGPLLAVFLGGCGGPPPPPAAPKEEAPAPPPEETAAPAAEAPPAEKAMTIPTACDGADDKICTVPEAFAKKLCDGFYPDLALHFFSEERWTRAYVNIKEADAWNALGGPASDQKLVYDEEVLILVVQKPKDLGGMQVSGAGASYHFLRWDGTCASLQAAEMTLRKPPKPKNAIIPWRSLEDPTKAALTADEKLGKIAAERKKECRGATIGAVTDKCEKADKALGVGIVAAVRGGLSIPVPEKVP